MPKKWQNHWGSLEDEQEIEDRNRKLLTLGNLTIITQSLNASVRDADWQTKKKGHAGKAGLEKYASRIETFSGYLDREAWDEDMINERRYNELYSKLVVVKGVQ